MSKPNGKKPTTEEIAQEVQQSIVDLTNQLMDPGDEFGLTDRPAPNHIAPVTGLTEVPTISVKIERNSKGFNYEASVSGARTAQELSQLLREAHNVVRAEITQTIQAEAAGSAA